MASVPWRTAARPPPSWRTLPPPSLLRRHKIQHRLYTAACRRPKTALPGTSLSLSTSLSRSRVHNHQVPIATRQLINPISLSSFSAPWKQHNWTTRPPFPASPQESRVGIGTLIAILAAGAIGYLVGGVRVELVELDENSPIDLPLGFVFHSKADVDYYLQLLADIANPGRPMDPQRSDDHAKEGYAAPRDGAATLFNGWELQVEEPKGSAVTTHGTQVDSNIPGEDGYAYNIGPGPGGEKWQFWGIYDGHAGGYTQSYLSLSLIPTVSQALGALPLSASSSAISDTIMQAFLLEDKKIMTRAQTALVWHHALSSPAIPAVEMAMSGSCALVSMYDPKRSILRVANVGDSRAVLGRWDEHTGKYSCLPLSVDQTGFNPDEVKRIKEEHRGEDDILDPDSGRLLGMAVTRAFGDHRWKWDNDLVLKAKAKFFGPGPRPNSKTPPYMTAEPVVREMEVVSVDAEEEKRRGSNARSDFLIMASDGLWDRMSSEDAVLLVQRWLEARERGNGKVQQDPQLHDRLTAELESTRGKTMDEVIGYKPEEVGGVSWRATPEYFVVEDENAAVCLYKNLIGGTRRWLQDGLLSMGTNRRNAVDDTTIMVVFFDKTEDETKKKGEYPTAKRNKVKDSWRPW